MKSCWKIRDCLQPYDKTGINHESKYVNGKRTASRVVASVRFQVGWSVGGSSGLETDWCQSEYSYLFDNCKGNGFLDGSTTFYGNLLEVLNDIRAPLPLMISATLFLFHPTEANKQALAILNWTDIRAFFYVLDATRQPLILIDGDQPYVLMRNFCVGPQCVEECIASSETFPCHLPWPSVNGSNFQNGPCSSANDYKNYTSVLQAMLTNRDEIFTRTFENCNCPRRCSTTRYGVWHGLFVTDLKDAQACMLTWVK